MLKKAFPWLRKTSAVFTLMLLIVGLGIQSSMADVFLPYVTMATATPTSFNASNNEYVFIECNPNGQWLRIEELTGKKIRKSIANLLIK